MSICFLTILLLYLIIYITIIYVEIKTQLRLTRINISSNNKINTLLLINW